MDFFFFTCCAPARPDATRREDLPPEMLAALDGSSRILNVWLRDCERLMGGDSSEPYVSMQLGAPPDALPLGPQSQTSTCRKRQLSPRWRPFEKFTFLVQDPSRTNLLITVKDRDLSKSADDDELLGTTVLALSRLLKHGEVKRLGRELSLIDPRSGARSADGSLVCLDVQLATKAVAVDETCDHVYEHSWWSSADGWSSTPPSSQDRFVSVDGLFSGATLTAATPPLRDGFAIASPLILATNKNGRAWKYSDGAGGWSSRKPGGVAVNCRRRVWCRVLRRDTMREMKKEGDDDDEDERTGQARDHGSDPNPDDHDDVDDAGDHTDDDDDDPFNVDDDGDEGSSGGGGRKALGHAADASDGSEAQEAAAARLRKQDDVLMRKAKSEGNRFITDALL